MTGYECLKEELYKLGCNKSQVEAKVVPLVLGVVAGDPEKFIKISEWESELEKKKNELKRREEAVEEDERAVNLLIDKALKIAKKTQDYVDAFYYAIQSGETPEGRDALRKAQMFVNSVTVETKYDNTAFIAGLAAILSEGKVAPMDELQKINPKIPAIRANGKVIFQGGEGYGISL